MRTGGRTLQFARKLRAEMSRPELLLWVRLRQQAVGAPRFRRQHPIGPYIADFYCPAAKLVIEIDGWSHNMGEQPARDEARDRWLVEEGYLVIRYSASDVISDPDTIADSMFRTAMALRKPPPSRRASPAAPPPPLCRGG